MPGLSIPAQSMHMEWPLGQKVSSRTRLVSSGEVRTSVVSVSRRSCEFSGYPRPTGCGFRRTKGGAIFLRELP